MTRTTNRLVRLAGALLIGGVVLAGCSSNSTGSDAASSSSAGSSDAAATAHNDADVTFVQGMIPHHQGALAMAKLADGRAADPGVIDLAGRIKAAQDPEIKTMTGWLKSWGEPLTEASGSSMNMNGMGSSSGAMDMGSMSAADMAALEAASGAEFDRMFLTMMTEHHRGAVGMAQTEITEGSNQDAVKLANSIVKSQTAEIGEMQTLLTKLGG